jgi:hypothetical protein
MQLDTPDRVNGLLLDFLDDVSTTTARLPPIDDQMMSASSSGSATPL